MTSLSVPAQIFDVPFTVDYHCGMMKKFDLLVQEAVRCDHSLAAWYKCHKPNDDHVSRVFTRLMLRGKVRAAMRWLTERSKGHVLDPNDQVTLHINGQDTTVNVIKALPVKASSSSTIPLLHLIGARSLT